MLTVNFRDSLRVHPRTPTGLSRTLELFREIMSKPFRSRRDRSMNISEGQQIAPIMHKHRHCRLTDAGMQMLRCLVFVGFLVRGGMHSPAQPNEPPYPYNALYCFGFSWTDTRLRVCNGPMWPEYLSTNLGLTYVQSNNFAQPGASTSATLSQVNQLRPSANPERGLYIAWVAAGDILSAADANFSGSEINWTNEVAWSRMLQSVLKTSSNIVERLYAKGARSVMIQNCLDLSLAPMVIRDIGANKDRLGKLKERTTRFNADLEATLDMIRESKPDLRLFGVDVFSHENDAYTNPAPYGFSKVFPDALSDPTLKDKSATGPAKDYMFWDRLHGTSKLQKLIADWTQWELTDTLPEKLRITMEDQVLRVHLDHLLLGRSYTLQNSSDLVQWREVEIFTAAAGTNHWTGSLGSGAGFYRLIWQP